ncbi:helix-turn-helix domain-containing protein [Micromonospora aurantiaca (nom. illeg.)]|uniref:helix-turn-helix domain-containing protein n=1 Tax=Micromonospora aurantiaca (nom. illeg.) TaxID=47850 RepID=UPI0037B2E0DD
MTIRNVQPIDPDSPAGRAAAEALSQALAEIIVDVWQRRSIARTQPDGGPAAGPAVRDLYPVNEAAYRLGTTPRTLWQLIKDKRIHSVRIGRRRLIPASAITDFIASLPSE